MNNAKSGFASNYATNLPFPHLVIEEFLDQSLAMTLSKEISEFSEWDGEKSHPGSIRKRYCGTLNKLPTTAQRVINFLNGPNFLSQLEEITGIPHLIPDPHMEGGGFHSIGSGGFLKIHADFNWHQRLQLHRRVNLLLYLNPEWKEEWGGNLELWDASMHNRVKSIPPTFNKLVIFSTTDTSFHGHPDPLKCPEGIYRNSIALYYYSSQRPTEELGPRGLSTHTNYKSRARTDGKELI